jgi:hypothetical protein
MVEVAECDLNDGGGMNDKTLLDRERVHRHAQHWTNRFILGDSLQAMASLVMLATDVC